MVHGHGSRRKRWTAPWYAHLWVICTRSADHIKVRLSRSHESRVERWLTPFRCKLIYTPFGDQDQFSVQAVDCYERALQKAQQSGTRVRALVITKPHNPLGKPTICWCRVSDMSHIDRSVLFKRHPIWNCALLQQIRYTPDERWDLRAFRLQHRQFASWLHIGTFD